MISFNELPTAVQRIQNDQTEIKEMLAVLLRQKRDIEQPINSKELMKRLAISEPTLIAMRKRGNIPYIQVRGNYRYNWHEVLAALNNPKK